MKPKKSSHIDTMNNLFSIAQEACMVGKSTSDFETDFVALLEFISLHPKCKPAAESRFISGIRDGILCWELIAFCMHSLRWPAVEEELRSSITEINDLRRRASLSCILDAMNDAWPDAALYQYYQHEGSAHEKETIVR